MVIPICMMNCSFDNRNNFLEYQLKYACEDKRQVKIFVDIKFHVQLIYSLCYECSLFQSPPQPSDTCVILKHKHPYYAQ